MDPKSFIEMAHAQVRDFVNGTRNKGQHTEALQFEVVTVWQCYILGNMKALITTDLVDGKYYEVTYNAAKNELYLDVYVRVHNHATDLRAILGDGEAPEHAMDDGRAENRREERTAPSADGIRA